MPDQPNKRSYGSGSLYERNGNWVGQWRPPGHKLVKLTLGPVRDRGRSNGLTRVMAEEEFRKARAEWLPPVVQRITIAEVGAAHLASVKLKGRKRATIINYESQLRVHLAPAFGAKTISAIQERDIERFIVERLDEDLSPKTVRNLLTHLHALFNYALRQKWVTYNPVALVDKPGDVRVDSDIRFLTAAEIERLLAVTVDPGRHNVVTLERAREVRKLKADGLNGRQIAQRLGVAPPTVSYYETVSEDPDPSGNELYRVERVLYLMAATTGLRQGELIALQWQDIDFASQRVRVVRNFVRGEFTTPKSQHSKRTVPMTDRMVAVLREHKLASQYAAAANLVFGHPLSGKPLDRSRTTERFKAAVSRAGVGRFATVQVNGQTVEKPLTRFHDLRHTFGTQMAMAGVPIRTIQAWMGHANIQTTEIYAAYAPNQHEIEMVNHAFRTAGFADAPAASVQKLIPN